MAARRALFDLALRAPARLALLEADTAFGIVTNDADSALLRTNWRRLERRVSDSVTVALRAKRQDGRLVVERSIRNAGKLTETYWVSPTSGQLFVLVRVESSGQQEPIMFRRVYDRAAPPP